MAATADRCRWNWISKAENGAKPINASRRNAAPVFMGSFSACNCSDIPSAWTAAAALARTRKSRRWLMFPQRLIYHTRAGGRTRHATLLAKPSGLPRIAILRRGGGTQRIEQIMGALDFLDCGLAQCSRLVAQQFRLLPKQLRSATDGPAVHDEVGQIEQPFLRPSERTHYQIDLFCSVIPAVMRKQDDGRRGARS